DGLVSFSDVDVLDTHTATVTPQGADYLGTFTLGAVDQPSKSVAWDFKVNDGALDSLGEGQTLTQVYTVTVDDGHGGTATQDVTIMLVGTNDAPVITFGNNGADANAGDTLAVRLGVPTSGVPLTSDGHTVTWTVSGDGQTLTGQVGSGPLAVDVIRVSLHNDGDGNYSYGVKLLAPVDHSDATIEDALNLGVPILVSDGHTTSTGSLTINIQDDSPVATSEDGGSVKEDTAGHSFLIGNVLTNGDAWGADGPKDAMHGFAWNTADNAATQGELSQYGFLALGTGGTWTFALNNHSAATQALAEGQTRDFALTYTLTDNDGDTSRATLTIHIVGTNDAPVITSGTQGATVTEIADNAAGENVDNHVADGLVSFSDVDVLDTHTATV